MPSVIEILGKEIPIYGFCYFFGIFLSFIVATLICRRRNLPKYEILYSGIFAVVGGLVGSKLLFILVSLKDIISGKLPILAVINGGFVFYGGFIGGAIGLVIYVKSFKLKLADFADVFAVAIPLGHAVGRVGCLFGGCCYGMPYDGPLSVTYTHSIGNMPINTPLLPIQGIESALLIVLFIILMVVYYNTKRQNLVLTSYLLGYSVIRFTLEYFRYDSVRGKLWIFTTSQWISIALFLIGLGYIYFIFKSRKSEKEK